jgi:hypothetical protein
MITHSPPEKDGTFSFFIKIHKCFSTNDLLKYLYDELYYEIISINENACISYHDHSGTLYAITDLFAGFSVNKLSDYLKYSAVEDYYERMLIKEPNEDEFYRTCDTYVPSGRGRGRGGIRTRPQTLAGRRCRNVSLIEGEKIQYDLFVNLVFFLCKWRGEYGHNVLTISNGEDQCLIIDDIEVNKQNPTGEWVIWGNIENSKLMKDKHGLTTL